ncbi:MAG: hypothetical protein KDB07_04390, partial [Planctomycetes bacterium]|nr:hypothetical protein [Planctomycetota bacterium]
FEAKGKGHWYDLDDEPGAACVDFGPIFDFFARRRLPRVDEVRSVDFRTYCPSVASESHWIKIDQQEQQLELSRVHATRKHLKREFTITTSNVQRFAFSPKAVHGAWAYSAQDLTASFTVDGQTMEVAHKAMGREEDGMSSRRFVPHDWVYFVKKDSNWALEQPMHNAPEKSASWSGLFKDAFRDLPVLVVPTGGTSEENAWALAKARFDAEQFLYRGNGWLPIIRDTDLARPHDVDDPIKQGAYYNRPGASILYGNADTNKRWPTKAAIQFKRGAVSLGGRTIESDALAGVATYYDGKHRYGFVASTGSVANRVIDHLNYFLSGTGFPDWAIYKANTLTTGSEGVAAAGFLGNDWKYDVSQSGFADPRFVDAFKAKDSE